MSGEAINIEPAHLQSTGQKLGGFGDKVSTQGEKLHTTGDKLSSHASRDKSGVGAVIVKAMGKAVGVTGKMFDEGGKYIGRMGRTLHESGTAHEHNEQRVKGEFEKIHGRPPTKGPHGGGGAHDEKTNGGGVKKPAKPRPVAGGAPSTSKQATAGAGDKKPPGTWASLAKSTANVKEPAIHAGSMPKKIASKFIKSEYPHLNGVNAKGFHQKTPGHNQNCTHCVVATDKALDGQRAVAPPSLHPRPISTVNAKLGGTWNKHGDWDSVIKHMAGQPEGSRGVVYVGRQNGSGHVFNVVHDKNGVVFLDGQTGKLGQLEPNLKQIQLLQYR